ncbi:MAG: hypothetical protein M1275_02345 [Patescibacteria group bacterium]|nr:hypothetical protein [Patescibacteria group bacterium]
MTNLSGGSMSKTRLLLISNYGGDDAMLRQFLRAPYWDIFTVLSIEAGRDAIDDKNVVICRRTLPDGDWKQVLKAANKLEPSPLVIVVCPQADDRLWAEVLNVGGYDVLQGPPFEMDELCRVLAHAAHHWHDK